MGLNQSFSQSVNPTTAENIAVVVGVTQWQQNGQVAKIFVHEDTAGWQVGTGGGSIQEYTADEFQEKHPDGAAISLQEFEAEYELIPTKVSYAHMQALDAWRESEEQELREDGLEPEELQEKMDKILEVYAERRELLGTVELNSFLHEWSGDYWSKNEHTEKAAELLNQAEELGETEMLMKHRIADIKGDMEKVGIPSPEVVPDDVTPKIETKAAPLQTI